MDSGRILMELGQKAPSEKNVKIQSTGMRFCSGGARKVPL
jgi:hypothetical protein